MILTRYFVLNSVTDVMHIYGCCRQTRPRAVPIRLFDTQQELEAYAGRKLTLCENCRRKMNEKK